MDVIGNGSQQFPGELPPMLTTSTKGVSDAKGVIVTGKEPFGYQKPSLDDSQLTEKLDRVDELVSLMLDDELVDESVAELEGLLAKSPEARTQYIGMVQLHTDLIEYYNPEASLGAVSPILATLGLSADDTPSTATDSDVS